MQATAVMIYDPSKEKPGQPDYYQTVRYIFHHIDFPISEDEAYVIVNLFIEKWDESQGQQMTAQNFVDHIVERCRAEYLSLMSVEKIEKVTWLIISYLRSIGQFQEKDAE